VSRRIDEERAAVLSATRELLDRYRAAPHAAAWRWESAIVDVIVRHGSASDTQALLPTFLEGPHARRRLVPIFGWHGDLSTAERLVAAGVSAGRLRAGVPAEVLHAVGFRGSARRRTRRGSVMGSGHHLRRNGRGPHHE
jgi:hypothetical protein